MPKKIDGTNVLFAYYLIKLSKSGIIMIILCALLTLRLHVSDIFVSLHSQFDRVFIIQNPNNHGTTETLRSF